MSDTVEVLLGRTRVTVPVHIDETATHALADAVTRRLEEIEAASTRIDTQLFALEAAFHFAAEADRLAREQEGDTQDLLAALERIRGRIEMLADLPDAQPGKM